MAYGNRVYSYTLKFNADVSNVRTQVQSVLEELSKISRTHSTNLTYDDELRAAAQAARELGNYIYKAFNVDTNRLDLTKFQRQLAQGNMSLSEYATKLSVLGTQGQTAFRMVANAITKAETPALQLNKILDSLWITMKNTMRWQLTSSMLHGFIGTVQTAWRYAQDLDESLNSIQRVTKMSTSEMSDFAKEANKAAQALNTTTVNYTDASLIYYQQGLDAEKVKERTRITIDAANAAGTSAQQMSEYLTAVWNSYQVATNQLESYVDKMTAVGASTATSLEEISTAMVNVASTANTVGVSMDQLTAIISTVASTTRQSASTIGTAYKTIFARMGDLKLGETLEDGLELGTVSKQLKSIGVDILDVNGDLREMGQVVEEIGEKWQGWTTAQQTAVAQAIAGKRQYTQLIALFDNWDAYQYALNVSENSEGALAKQAEIYAESWEAARDNVKASMQGIYDSLINAKGMADFDRSLAKILNRIENVVDALGGFSGVLQTGVYLMFNLYGNKLVAGLHATRDAYLQLSGIQEKRNNALRDETIEALRALGINEKIVEQLIQRNQLQIKLDSSKGRLSKAAQEQAQYELDILNLMQEQYLETLRINDEKAKGVDNYLNNITTQSQGNIVGEFNMSSQYIPGSLNDTLIEVINNARDYKELLDGVTDALYKHYELNKVIRGEEQAKKFAVAFLASEEKKIVEQVKEQNIQYGAISAALERIQKLNAMDVTGDKAQEVKSRLMGIVEELEKIPNLAGLEAVADDGSTLAVITEHLKEDINNLNRDGIERLIQNLSNIKDKLEQTGRVNIPENFTGLLEVITKLELEYQNLGQNTIFAAEQQKILEEQSSRVRASIESQLNGINDWANSVVNIGRNISSTGMALSQIINLSRTFDEAMQGNISVAELLTRTLTGIGILLPILVRGYQGLSKAIAANTVIQNLASKANLTLVATTNLVGLGIVAVGVAIAAGLHFWDEYIHAEENAREAIAKTTEETQAQKDSLQSLQDDLENIQEQIEQLQSEGPLDIVKQEELDKLREREATLERQVALQERLYRAQLREQKEILDDKSEKATKTAYEGYDNQQDRQFGFEGTIDLRQVTAIKDEQLAALFENEELYEEFVNSIPENISSKESNLSVEEQWRTFNETQKQMQLQLYQAYRDYWIERNKAAFDEWLRESEESYRQAEEDFAWYLDMYESQINEELITEEEFTEQLERLAQIRRNRFSEYDEDGYYNTYISKIFKNQSFSNEFSSLFKEALQQGDISSELSNGLTKYIYRQGISVDEFLTSITEKVNKVKDNLSKFMGAGEMEDFLSKLTPEDQDVLFRLNFDGLDNFNDFYRRFLELKYDSNISINFDIAVDAAKEALASIAAGEFLDDEAIQGLKDKFAQIYDFSNLEDLSLYDQARNIGQALIIASDPITLYNQQLDESKEKLEDINKELKKQEDIYDALTSVRPYSPVSEDADKELRKLKNQINELNEEKIEVELDIDNATDALNELRDMSDIEIKLEVDSSMVDAVVGQMGAIEKAASLIGEGFKVEAKNVETLMKTLPQLFEDATIDVETGMVQLQQSIVNKVAETAREEVNLTAQGLRERLTNRYNAIQGEIDLLNQVKENAFNAGQSEVTSAKAFNNMEHQDKVKVVQAIIKARLQQAIQEKTQSAQAASNAVQDQNKVREASELQGQQVAANWRKVAEAAAKAFRAFAQQAVQDQKDVAEGKTPTSKFNMPSLGSVGFSSNASELSWNYETAASDQFNILNKWAKNGFNASGMADEYGHTLNPKWVAEQVAEQLDILGLQLDQNVITKGSEAVIDSFISSNYDNWGDFVQDIDTGLNDKYYELGITANDLSKLLAGIGNSGVLQSSGLLKDKKGGSSKEKQPKEAKGSELDPKEIEERYHEINELIEQQERLLGDVQTQIDRTYGISKLKQYNQEQERLNALIDSQTTKMNEAAGWAQSDLEKIKSLDLTPELSDDGRILNYTQMLAQATEEYNKFVEEWNSHQNEILQPDANGEYGKSWQEQHQQEKEQLEKMYQDRLDALKKFEDSVQTYWTEFEKREQYYRDLEDNKLRKIAYVLEFQIDYKDAKKDVRNLSKTIEESFGDSLTHGIKTAVLDYQNMLDERDMKPIYDQNFNELLAKIDESKTNKYIDQEELANQLANLRDNVIESAEAMIEWAESVEDIVPDAIDAARERFDQFTDQLEHNTSIIDTIKEIMVLQGLTIKTAQGYRDIRDMYNKRMDATLAQAKLNRQWYDSALKELQVAQTALDGATEGTEEFDILKANRDALLTQFKDAQAAMLESAKETMETAREMYIDGVERTAYELEQVLTKGDGFDLLQDKYDHYIDTEERYLDTVNKIYETTKLNNKLQEQIDKSTNSAHTKRLKELQEEFQEREKNNKLSEYDIEIMNAKLAMLTKQMELEEAANNKSTLRMVRNSRGNYDYQFTANPDELNSINQEYLDAAQEYYNIAKDKVKEVSGEIIDTWQEMTDKIKEVYEDETLTVDEREAKIAEIRAYYSQKVKDLEAEKQKAILDMTEAGNIAINDFRDAHKNVLDEMGGDVDSFKDLFSDDLAAILGGVDDFNNTFAEDMDNLSGEVNNFDEIFDQTIDSMNEHVDEFNNKVQDVNDQVGTSYDDLKDILDQVADSTEQLTWKGQEQVTQAWEQISAVQQLSQEYAVQAEQIMNLARQYRDLANAINELQFNKLGQAGDMSYNKDPYENITYDPNVDYSALMSKYLQDGGSMSDVQYQELLAQRNLLITDYLIPNGYGKDYYGTYGEETNKLFGELVSGGGNQDWYNSSAGTYDQTTYLELLKKLGITGFATGGYTGDFDNGKLAILHEKELVLNEDDTKNILNVVDTVRGLDISVWLDIAKALDSSVMLFKTFLADKLGSIIKVEGEKGTLEQKVEIQAHFDGVRDAREIEEALTNIVNNAAQFASQRD